MNFPNLPFLPQSLQSFPNAGDQKSKINNENKNFRPQWQMPPISPNAIPNPWMNPMFCTFPFPPNMMNSINPEMIQKMYNQYQESLSKFMSNNSQFQQNYKPIPNQFPFKMSNQINHQRVFQPILPSSSSNIHDHQNKGSSERNILFSASNQESSLKQPKNHSQHQKILSKIHNEASNLRRVHKKCSEKIRRWSREECQLYDEFIRRYDSIMSDSTSKRMTKVFLFMSQYVQTKTPSQCRSHHQKFYSKVKDAMVSEGFVPSNLKDLKDEFGDSLRDAMIIEMERRIQKKSSKSSSISSEESDEDEYEIEEKSEIEKIEAPKLPPLPEYIPPKPKNQIAEVERVLKSFEAASCSIKEPEPNVPTQLFLSCSEDSDEESEYERGTNENVNMQDNDMPTQPFSNLTNMPNDLPLNPSESTFLHENEIENNTKKKQHSRRNTRSSIQNENGKRRRGIGKPKTKKGKKNEKVEEEIKIDPNAKSISKVTSEPRIDTNFKRKRNMCENYDEEEEDEVALDFLEEESEEFFSADEEEY